MKDIQELKSDYESLSVSEKARVGESMVKVNLGLGMPEDLRCIAAFLKGSFYIAKEGELEALIQALNTSDPSSQKNHQDNTQVLVSREIELNKTQIKNISSFDEDSEVTQKDKL